MRFGYSRRTLCLFFIVVGCISCLTGQTQPASSPSSSAKTTKQPAAPTESNLEPGSVTNHVYRHKTLSLACKIPEAWVVRTDELNSREEEKNNPESVPAQAPASSVTGKVLLAAFSRPPEAKGEEINSSILI